MRQKSPVIVPVVLGLCGLTLAAAGAALVYETHQVQRPAEGNPADFLAGGTRPARRVVACIGASIVHGRVSVDVVDLLRRMARAPGPKPAWRPVSSR